MTTPAQRRDVISIIDRLHKDARGALQDMPDTWTEQEIRWWLVQRLRQYGTLQEKRRYAAFQNDLLNNPRL